VPEWINLPALTAPAVSSLYHRGFALLLCWLSLKQNKTPFQKIILLDHSDKLPLKKDLKRHYKSY
jgi:hypothetical protein